MAIEQKDQMTPARRAGTYTGRKTVLTVLLGTMLWGLLAHGLMLLNFYCFHDGCGQFTLGTTYNMGRWFLDVLESLHKVVWGLYTYEVNWYQGIVTLLFIAAANFLIIDLMAIECPVKRILFCGITAVFPSVTGLFAYMFTAPYYGFSLFLSVLSAYLLCRVSEKGKTDRKALFLCGLASVFLCLSIAIYQGYISHFLTVVLFYLIRKLLKSRTAPARAFPEGKPVRALFRSVFPIGLSAVFALLLYFASNKLYLLYKDAGIGGYRGMDHYGITSLSGYLDRIVTAYRTFFTPDPDFGSNMFPYRLYTVYRYILIPAVLAASAVLLVRQFRFSVGSGLCLSLLLFSVPAAVNFIYISSGAESAYSLTLYGQSLIFAFVLLLGEGLSDCFSGTLIKRLIGWSVTVLLLYSCIFYCKLDNIQYTKLGEYIEQNKSWYTTLVTRIKSTEGFSDELPVVYISEYDKNDSDFYHSQLYDNIAISPYDNSNMSINGYWWKDQMRIYTGFDPVLEDEEIYASDPDVQEMPCYPDDGSIAILDGTIIVKFG